MAKHINIIDDIKNKIIDFTHGDDKYWKNKFHDVVNELNEVEFFCETRWCCNECNVCNKCFNDYTVELKYDEALKTYLNDYVGRKCSWCSCKIINCKISFVNEKNYYKYLEEEFLNDKLDFYEQHYDEMHDIQ